MELPLKEQGQTKLRTEQNMEKQLTESSISCFLDAKEAFEEIIQPDDIEAFKKLCLSQRGPKLLFYVKTLSYLPEFEARHAQVLGVMQETIPNVLANASPHFTNKKPYFGRIK